jgi:hypothetical protein
LNSLGITYQEYNNDKSGPYTNGGGNFTTSDLALSDLGPYPVVPVAVAGAPPTLNHYAAVRNYMSCFIVGFNLEKLLDMWASGLSLENEMVQIKGDCKQNVGATAPVQASIMLHYNCVLRISRGQIDVLERA